MDIWGSRSGVA